MEGNELGEPHDESERILGTYRLNDEPRIHMPPESMLAESIFPGVDQPQGLETKNSQLLQGGSEAQQQQHQRQHQQQAPEAENLRSLETLLRPFVLRSRQKPSTLLQQQPQQPPQQQQQHVTRCQGPQQHVVRPLAIVFETANDSKKPEGSRKRYPLPPQPPPAPPPPPPSSSSSLGLEFVASKHKHSPSRSTSTSQRPSPKHAAPAPGASKPSPWTSPSKSPSKSSNPTSVAAPPPILGPDLDATHRPVLGLNQGPVEPVSLPHHTAPAPCPSCVLAPPPASCPFCQGVVPRSLPPVLQSCHNAPCHDVHHAAPATALRPQSCCCNPAAATAACPWQQQQQPSLLTPSIPQAPSQVAQQRSVVHMPEGPGKEVSSLLLKEELSIHPEAPLPLHQEGMFLDRQQPWQQQQQQQQHCCCAAPAALRRPNVQCGSLLYPQYEPLHLPLHQKQQWQQWQAPFARKDQHQQPLQPLRQSLQMPQHQQQGGSWGTVDDDSDGDGLPGRCQDGGAEGGRSALLQFLHHKMTQLRHHRLLRNVLVAWKQTASAKKIDRLLLETVDRLHAERVLQGTFAAWRSLAQGGVRSPRARSPAHGSWCPTPVDARTPCSSNSSCEPARPARTTLLSPLPLISPLPQLLSPTLGPVVPGRAESAVAAAVPAPTPAGGQDPLEVQEDSGAQASPTSSVSFRPFVGQAQDEGSQHSTPCMQLPIRHGDDGSRGAFDEMRRMLLRMEAMLRQPEGLNTAAHKPLSSSNALGQNGAPFHPTGGPLPEHTDHTPCKEIPCSTTSQVSAILRSPGGTVLDGGRANGFWGGQEVVEGGTEAQPGRFRSNSSWSSSHDLPSNTILMSSPQASQRAQNSHCLLAAGQVHRSSWCPPEDAGTRTGMRADHPPQDARLRAALSTGAPPEDAGLRGPTAQTHHAAHHPLPVQQDVADLQSRIGLLLQGRQAGEARSAARPPPSTASVGEARSAVHPPYSAAPAGEPLVHGPLAEIPAMRAQLQGMLHHLARVEAEVERRQHLPSYGSPHCSATAQAPSIWVPTLHHTSRMPIPSKPKWRAVEQGTQDPESLLQLELAELEQKLQSIRAKQNDLAC